MAFFNSHRALVCLLALYCSLVSQSGWSSPWFTSVRQADDGLPGDNVTGIAQKDGYLWIATQSGLARFDGVRIQTIPVAVGRQYPLIRSMLLDRQQRLWLAQEGGLLACVGPGETKLITATNGLLKLQPSEMVQAADDAIWIGYVDGSVCRLSGNKAVSFSEADGYPTNGTCSLTSDSQGTLWFARGGQVGVHKDGKFTTKLNLPEKYVQVQARRSSGIWLCAGDRLLRYQDGGEVVELGRLPIDASLVRSLTIYEDRSGAVWIGTSVNGLFRYDGTNIVAVETSHGRIRTVMEDREGNIWVGTDGGGLNRLRRQVVELQRKEDGLPFDTVRSTTEDVTGALWIVTQNGDVAVKRDDKWETVSAATSWPGGQATCVVADPNGTIWIGTYLRGLYRWRNGEFKVLRRSSGLAASSVRSLLLDKRGDLWIAYSSGDTLQRYRDGKFANYRLPEGSKPIRAMTEGSAGDIWMANLDAQLLHVKGDTVVDETPRLSASADELRHPIRCLLGTTDGSLWIGYSAIGIGRLKDGKFAIVNKDRGLPDNSICSLMVDDRRWVWVGSDHGIFRVNEAELSAVADGKATTLKSIGYGRDEGLPSLQGYYGYSPGASRTRDGRVLIPTHSGLAIVHSDRVQTNSVKPPVIIESVLVDNHVVREGLSYVPLRLPATYRKLEVAYTAPSFIEPEKIRFRHWLKGAEDDWSEVTDRRSVVYSSRLPAGKYEFHLEAGNSAGVWSQLGAPVAFVVEPLLREQLWFQAALILLFTGLIAGTVRLVFLRRLRVRLRRLEQENALQNERARIAQDIHDDFGACMTQISLLAELAQQNLTRPDKAKEHVTQIATMSREGIKSLDEIVWAVNPRNDTLPDLLDYAGQYAVDFLQAAGIRCRIDFPEVPPSRDLTAEVRHALFLAVKEALTNVVKHAQATEVWLRVRLTDTALQWSVEDDGRGFDDAANSPQADGLRNMRQRLAQIGGVCSIEARAGKGTSVKFEVPWRKNE